MNLNKVFLIGRLTADPQLRTTSTGQSVATISIATNRNWMNKNGQKQEEVQFHNVVVWGRQAEIASQFLRKGGMVFVEGRLQTRSWQDARGETRKTTEIVSERLQLGPRAFGSSSAGNSSQGESSFVQKSPLKQGVDEEQAETLPEINIDEGEIKPEDIPF